MSPAIAKCPLWGKSPSLGTARLNIPQALLVITPLAGLVLPSLSGPHTSSPGSTSLIHHHMQASPLLRVCFWGPSPRRSFAAGRKQAHERMNGLTLGVSVTLCINKRKVPSGSNTLLSTKSMGSGNLGLDLSPELGAKGCGRQKPTRADTNKSCGLND